MSQYTFYLTETKSYVEEKGDSKNYVVEGYASTQDKDLVNDIVTKACIDDMADQLKSRSVKIDYEHETMMGDDPKEYEVNKTKLPLGKITDYKVDSKGLWIKAVLNPSWKKLDKEGNISISFKEVWSSVKNKFLDAFSIAYVPLRAAFTGEGEDATRLLDRVNLLNVALTGNPVNPAASMTGFDMKSVMMKSLDNMENNEDDTMAEENLQMEVKNLKASVEGKDKEISKLQEEKKSLEESKESLEKEKKSLEEEKSQLEKDKKALEEEKEKLEQKSNEEDNEVKSLKQKLEEQEKQIKALDEKLSKPVHKGYGPENKSNDNNKDEGTNVLGMI